MKKTAQFGRKKPDALQAADSQETKSKHPFYYPEKSSAGLHPARFWYPGDLTIPQSTGGDSPQKTVAPGTVAPGTAQSTVPVFVRGKKIQITEKE